MHDPPEQLPKDQARWSRRGFLATAVVAGAGLVGGAGNASTLVLKAGSFLAFENRRSRPGFDVVLHADLRCRSGMVKVSLCHMSANSVHPDSELASVDLALGSPVRTMLQVPMATVSEEERAQESYQLVAVVFDDRGVALIESEPLEVLVSPFSFGM